MSHPVLAVEGEKLLLLGNEAIVRGALEAGINMVTCYPGTPSSEVPDLFYSIRGCGRYVMEYSINEKVAYEVAAGAALGGALSLVTMKHVGVNVAADPLFTSTYIGLPGGLVLMSADDPGCHSSQNEQDNRTYARFAGMPCFEPSTAQEAKDMTRDALLLSRSSQQPVMLRTTTRVSHLRGPVLLGPLPEKGQDIVDFKREPLRFVPVPAVSRRRHFSLVENLESIRELAENSQWNSEHGTGGIGVIASGIGRNYLHDAIMAEGLEEHFTVLDLGLTWPLPEKKLQEFMRRFKRILIVEEGEPLLEKDLRALAQKNGIAVEIVGKGGALTIYGEYSTAKVASALHYMLEGSYADVPVAQPEPLPQRPPNLCAGCAHRAVFYATRQVFGDDAIYSSDIGCYTLGMAPPLRMADFLVCMGSSISAGSGFARSSGTPVVAFLGDSTFFHSGLSGLVNAIFNKHNLLVVVLDNGTTAMTGHQPNPGMDQDVLGAQANHLDIESIVRGLGVEHVAKVKPLNLRATSKILEEMKALDGVRVIIAEEPCVLYARRVTKRKRNQVAYVAEQSQECVTVAETLACPAFSRQGDKLDVEADLCAGCMFCLQISRNFKAQRRAE